MNVDSGQATLSLWGELVWREAYRAVYGADLLEPITPKLVLGPRFQQTLEGLAPDRLRHVNERLDQLARRLEEGETYNPSSLIFKKLEGGSHKGSTHECNAWADQDAKRLFGHFEGGRYVIDRLDKGLH